MAATWNKYLDSFKNYDIQFSFIADTINRCVLYHFRNHKHFSFLMRSCFCFLKGIKVSGFWTSQVKCSFLINSNLRPSLTLAWDQYISYQSLLPIGTRQLRSGVQMGPHVLPIPIGLEIHFDSETRTGEISKSSIFFFFGGGGVPTFMLSRLLCS